MSDATTSRVTIDDVRAQTISETETQLNSIVASHREHVRELLYLVQTAEADAHAASYAPPAAPLVPDEHAGLPKLVLPNHAAQELSARLAQTMKLLRENATRNAELKTPLPPPDTATQLPPPPAPLFKVQSQPKNTPHPARNAAVRLPPSPMPRPVEYDQTLPNPTPPLTLQTLAPNPLSVTYASSLRPLPPDPSRRVTGIGTGGGSVHHRTRRSTQRPGPMAKPVKGTAGPDLLRWQVRIRACPSASLVRKASKCLLTGDWKVAFTEQKFLRAMMRMEDMKQQGLWSFRQPKRVKGRVERKTHWDYVLEEMRWMQTDFREERKWKLAMAYEFAHQIAQWHRSSPEERASLCVSRRRVEPMQWEEPEPAPGSEPEPAPEAESEAESDPKARVQDDPADEPRDEKPSNEPDIDVDADAEGEDDSQAMPRLTYTEPPAKADEPAQPMRSDANKETTLSDKLPLALVTAIRAPIFSLDTTATTVSPWSLLEHLDPQTSAALMRMDDAPSIDPEQLDFDKLFPELPPYAPPNASDDPASQKRRDESQAQSTRLVHVSRLLDAKPILVSTLDPARYRENGHWVDTSEWAERMPHAPEVSPPYVAGVPPGSLLFSRRAGKAPRESMAGPRIPTAPAHPDARVQQLSWSSEQDAFVQALAKQYHDHWSLVADLFNAACFVIPTEKRTAWDCYDRCQWLATAADQRPSRPAPRDSKQAYRQHLLDMMRKWAKRREQIQRQAAANAAANASMERANLTAHDTHTQVKMTTTPTPQALSALKAERDQAAIRQFFEQQRAAQFAYAQQQQRLQLVQAQAAQANDDPHRKAAAVAMSASASGAAPAAGVAAAQSPSAAGTTSGSGPSPAASAALLSRSTSGPAPPPPHVTATSSPSSTSLPPQQQYLAAMSANQGAATAAAAATKPTPAPAQPPVMMAGPSLPLARAAQPYFGVDSAAIAAATSASPLSAANLKASTQPTGSPIVASATQGPPRPPQPIVIASSASPSSRLARPAPAGVGFDAQATGTPSPMSTPAAPAIPMTNAAAPGVNAVGRPPTAVAGPGSSYLGSTQAAPTSAPPNLHALQQQLAITLAASHLSQEQINSLAIQLYKQAQQQQQQQRAQPDGHSQGSAPTGLVGHAPRFVPVPQPSAGSHTTSLPANHHATPPSRQT